LVASTSNVFAAPFSLIVPAEITINTNSRHPANSHFPPFDTFLAHVGAIPVSGNAGVQFSGRNPSAIRWTSDLDWFTWQTTFRPVGSMSPNEAWVSVYSDDPAAVFPGYFGFQNMLELVEPSETISTAQTTGHAVRTNMTFREDGSGTARLSGRWYLDRHSPDRVFFDILVHLVAMEPWQGEGRTRAVVTRAQRVESVTVPEPTTVCLAVLSVSLVLMRGRRAVRH